MQLEFDERGNLMPYVVKELTLEDLEQFFVKEFKDSSTRFDIFESYKNYISDISQILKPDFRQWIDGSFVSRKLNPNDIDLVTFIDFEDFHKHEKVLMEKFIYPNSKLNYKVDAYAVRIYPIEHELFNIGNSDTFYWNDWFSYTRRNRANKRFKKGFIEIKFK